MKKIFLLILCLSTMYPVVNAGRVVQSFNDGWYYVAYNDNRFQKVRCHEEGWEQVHLPHTWNTDAYSTRNYRRASSWYKKEFRRKPQQMRDKQLYLKFRCRQLPGRCVPQRRAAHDPQREVTLPLP